MEDASNGGARAPRKVTRKPAAKAVRTVKAPAYKAWRDRFIEVLSATSNVTAAAKAVGIHTKTAYDIKRTNAEFNRRWRTALCEGYELLEMSLLQRMREGELKRAGEKRAVRTFDNAVALRLLAAHRAEAARHRAVRDNEDVDTILDSLNAKLERMREARFGPREPLRIVGMLPVPAENERDTADRGDEHEDRCRNDADDI